VRALGRIARAVARIALALGLIGAVLVAVLSFVMAGRPPWVSQEPVALGDPAATPTAVPGPTGGAGGGASPSALPTPGTAASTTTPTAPAEPRAELVPLAAGLESPIVAVDAGDGSGRLLVVEQVGRIRVVRDGRLEPGVLVDLSDRLVAGGEQGLLGLAVHPRFPADPRLFVNYTDLAGDTVVASLEVADAGRGDRVDPGTERILLRIDQPYPNHNGGHLAFGPDGFLYIGTGDGGLGGDPHGYGQDRTSLLGKILRIDVDRATAARPYSIPADNPFASGGGAAEIWAIGLRNPWRFAFDPATGDLWIGDVGQNAVEEVSVVRAGSPAPANLGWKITEGDLCFSPATGCDATGQTLPAAVYTHDVGCSVTGGPVARGDATSSLAGRVLFADYCSGTIWTIDAAADGPQAPRVLLETGRRIASFGVAADGTILVLDLERGELLELAPR
jgi:glucose/arabinose dehydrogenase